MTKLMIPPPAAAYSLLINEFKEGEGAKCNSVPGRTFVS